MIFFNKTEEKMSEEEMLEAGGTYSHIRGMPCVAVSPNETIVATGSNAFVRLWSEEYRHEEVLDVKNSNIVIGGETGSFHFSVDGHYLAILLNDNVNIKDVIQIWDISKDKPKLHSQLESENYEDEECEYAFVEMSMNFAKFSNDSSFFLTSPWSSEIYVYGLDMMPLKKLKGHKDIVENVLFSKNSTFFLSWDEGGYVCLWDVESLELLKSFQLIENMLDVSFINNDKILLYITKEGVFFWSMEQEHVVEKLELSNCKKAIVSKDERYMATYNGKTIILWNFEKREKLYEIVNGSITINDIAFQGTNRVLFVTEDFKLKIWDIELNKLYIECEEKEWRPYYEQ